MPMVIFRLRDNSLYCYIAKQDLEAKVLELEHNLPECWGGRISLEGGKAYYIAPQPAIPRFPVSLRATRSEY
ncbi:putative nitrogen fixation protein NifT [Rahnella sp. SAP-1]|jgi:nitrogen fixation protein NifT|uniref:Putative nitrogen fixation protein NifT n=1 Tax=Rouxiella aceris TaxID=2703884 RepID=A0A848MH19_9GAMM|nr:putative nitrogen fixation protein NifT [Rouxiella aceris]NMP26636.1 putative nitrogen fixation protein NifT [Rouxiella aceris]